MEKHNVRFKKLATNALQSRRAPMLSSVARRFRGYANAKDTPTYDTEDRMILNVAQVYGSLIKKHNGPKSLWSTRKGTRCHKAFQKVASICAENQWLIGEFLSAQFDNPKGYKTPLLNHLGSPGAQRRYKEYVAMYRGRSISSVTSPSEEITIQRTTRSSIDNLVVLLLSRGKVAILDDDFSFMDRYSLAYFARRARLPPKQFHPDVKVELDALSMCPARWDTITRGCSEALGHALKKLSQVATLDVTSPVNRLRSGISVALKSLYA